MNNQNKVRKTICIKPNLWNEAKEVSERIGTSISTLISMAIIEKLNKIQNEKN